MVKKVQEENSNFQNGNLYIENIDTKRAADDCLRVVLSDGSFFFVRYEFYIENHLCLDLIVDENLFELLEGESSFLVCNLKAYDLLSRRDHSRRELEIKLLQRSFSKDVISLVLEKMELRGFLNDKRFAQKRVKSLIARKVVSRNFVKSDLYKKGIDREIIDEVLKANFSDDVEIDMARKLYSKLLERKKDNIVDKMLSKGFNYSTVKYIMGSGKGFDDE